MLIWIKVQASVKPEQRKASGIREKTETQHRNTGKKTQKGNAGASLRNQRPSIIMPCSLPCLVFACFSCRFCFLASCRSFFRNLRFSFLLSPSRGTCADADDYDAQSTPRCLPPCWRKMLSANTFELRSKSKYLKACVYPPAYKKARAEK